MVLLQALLTAYIPYLTIDCTAELVLFRPKIGNVLGEQQTRLLAGKLATSTS
jgi:hypothetical protein